MSLPPYLRADASGVWLAIKAQPRASKSEIGGAVGNELKVKVTAPPVDSAANAAIVELLADLLDCPRGAVRITRGQKSAHKTIQITGLTPEAVAVRLAPK
jgi:uncharacterized protein (TIGR00251 family)